MVWVWPTGVAREVDLAESCCWQVFRAEEVLVLNRQEISAGLGREGSAAGGLKNWGLRSSLSSPKSWGSSVVACT